MWRQFKVDCPDRLWVMDVTEHPTGEGKVYLGVVIDAWSRRVVGWSIADHMRAELVVDALQMAIWRRQPAKDQDHRPLQSRQPGQFRWSSQHLETEVILGWPSNMSANRRCV